jgi:hypothetical protein
VFSVTRIPACDWKELSKQAHLVTFGEYRENLDRIDYALTISCNGELGGYMTIKEMDAETAYIQHGGVFPNFAKSVYVLGGYKKFLKVLRSDYKRVWTRVENTNVSMLKLALSQGFIVNGTSLVKGKLYLEMILGD